MSCMLADCDEGGLWREHDHAQRQQDACLLCLFEIHANPVVRRCGEPITQFCHFHYLREAAKPLYEADRHAKKEIKEHLRGVRPIGRGLEHRQDTEAEVIRGYCPAVRSALTDDGQAKLRASGLKLHGHIAQITASLARIAEKGGLPRELERIRTILTKGLAETHALWADVEMGHRWVRRGAHLLADDAQQTAAQVRQQSRCAQFCFRRDPDTHLATLENKLLQLRLLP